MLKQKLLEKLPPFLRNKYVLVLVIFVLWMMVFDESSFINRISNQRKLNDLERQKEHYLEQIDKDKNRLKELSGDKKEIEKFAREQYLMKKENEDIFIIKEDD